MEAGRRKKKREASLFAGAVPVKWSAFLVLVLLWVWAGILWAGDAQIQVPAPRYDFGEAGEGETIHHEFKILNSGSEALQLIDVRPG